MPLPSYQLQLWRRNMEDTAQRFKLRLSRHSPWSYVALFAVFSGFSYIILHSPIGFTSTSTTPFLEDVDVETTPTPINYPFSPHEHEHGPPLLKADFEKQEAVVNAFKYAWKAYESHAFGSDEYHSVSHRGTNFSSDGGVGYTIVDALDTMYLMGTPLRSEYERAKEWVANELSFDRRGTFITFETTIRVLGGLLSMCHLTSTAEAPEAQIYLSKTLDLASRMFPVFPPVPPDTPKPGQNQGVLPAKFVNLADSKGFPSGASIAEVATLQLEFKYAAELSKLAGTGKGNEEWWFAAERVMSIVREALKDTKYGAGGLAPIFMDTSTGAFQESSEIRLGSNGDSYYEYLLKQYLQTARTEPVYKDMYRQAMQGIHDHLVKKTAKKGLTYIAPLTPKPGPKGVITWQNGNRQEHLVCFLAGSLMLGATTVHSTTGKVSVPPARGELSKEGWRDWNTGIELLEGCMRTHETRTGLSPEIAAFGTDPNDSKSDRDWYIEGNSRGGNPPYDARYMLRPETVESLFLAWRLTGDQKYRDYSWKIFQAIETYCKLPLDTGGGYATVLDVDSRDAEGGGKVRMDDKQETFFLSETLKYIYLTFSDSTLLPLDELFLFGLQDSSRVEPLIESFVRASIVGGQLYVFESPESGVVGAELAFGPGQVALGSEEQKEQGFNQLMDKVNEDVRRWFNGYFVDEMLHSMHEPVYGPGVQHDNYHIQLLGVLPEYQGKGIGKALLQHVEAKAKSENLDVVLETPEPEKVAFYQKMGYEIQGNGFVKHPTFPSPLKVYGLRKRL
ncbi:mannosyl-oligosaccharide alpha-1,2-mannosidase [Marasmius sp. AFHP31]|nr:mannosyl-oligosaccharide alpha-1,2-mannosidase [Marasmius sp. AFHP31]